MALERLCGRKARAIFKVNSIVIMFPMYMHHLYWLYGDEKKIAMRPRKEKKRIELKD